MTDLSKKVERAKRLIQSASVDGQIVEVAYSGGKDSDVILALTQMAGIPFKAIYKNTTIDPPGTIKHCKSKGVEIRNPKQSFYEIISKNGFPNRFRRFCCRFLKEYKILDKSIVGIRSEESVKRAARYKEPTQCRVYTNGDRSEQFFPILDWTNDDVLQFIISENIQLHPLYYRNDGTIDISKRLGCIGCPLASENNRIKSFLKYPNMVKLYLRGGKTSLTPTGIQRQERHTRRSMTISWPTSFIQVTSTSGEAVFSNRRTARNY